MAIMQVIKQTSVRCSDWGPEKEFYVQKHIYVQMHLFICSYIYLFIYCLYNVCVLVYA